MTSEPDMQLVVAPVGDIRCIYGEDLALHALGRLSISRASHVEPDADGFWFADMGPVEGPVLGPFRNRTEALAAERGWLNEWNHYRDGLKSLPQQSYDGLDFAQRTRLLSEYGGGMWCSDRSCVQSLPR